mgnify:FL=1
MSEVLERAFDTADKSHWQIKTLGQVCRTSSGGTPSRSRPDLFNGNIPWVKSGELTDGLVSQVSEFISEEALAGSSAKLLPAGTLLIAMYGATVGKLGVLARAAATNQAVCAIFPPPELDPKFLFWYLRRQRSNLIAMAVGGAQPNISQTILRDLELPIPPLGEQREIVAELEKQFSRLDEAVANLQRVKANLKRYKASVLKAAVEGRLVETEATLARREGRTYETGEQLLQRILESRPSAWKGKYDSPTPPECLDDALTPDGWTWITVSQAMRERIVNGLSIKESATPTSVRALKLSAMSDQGLDFNDFRWLPIELSKVEDIVIRESDFFVSRGNGSLELVGRGSPAQEPKQAVIFPDTMMRIRFSRVANVGPWFHALWTTRLVRAQIEKRVKTTAGIYKMAQPELASITVPLPPLAEQARIVAEVDRHLSIIHEVEAEVGANLQRAQALRQATLAKAFSSKSIAGVSL